MTPEIQRSVARHMMGVFRMAVNDCVLSALRVSDDITGCNKAELLASLYNSDEAANRILDEHNGLSPAVSLYYRSLGFAQNIDQMYQEGDLAVLDGKTVGVWVGDGWACKGPRGFRIRADAPHVYYRPSS